MKHGADVNQTTNTSSTPLRVACYEGHLHIVKYLVEHGADIEIANKDNHTPLMIAAHKGKADVVKYLLSVKASVDREDHRGDTALHDAAISGCTKAVVLLLLAGAAFKYNKERLSPFGAAASSGQKHLLPLLDSYATEEEKLLVPKLLELSRIRLVRGNDRGRKAWHYVLVDEERMEQFLQDANCSSMDVAKYGRVLRSGWGEDPPQHIRDSIDAELGGQSIPITTQLMRAVQILASMVL